MEATAPKQRRRAPRKSLQSFPVRIEWKDRLANPQSVTADLVDAIDGGLGLALAIPLQSGSTVIVRGSLGDNHVADHFTAGVRWCVGTSNGTFRAGLEFLDSRTLFPLDCYEVMQLRPDADPKAISRAYRMLAARYHPDNVETADPEKFLQLSEAHRILSDPKKRADYDLQRRGAKRLPYEPTGQYCAKQRNSREDAVDTSQRNRRKTDQRAPSAGELRGWNTALRHL